VEHLCNGLRHLPLRLETEGVSRKQRAPREEPKPPALAPPQEQAVVGEVFDDESTMWRAVCVTWPSELQGLVVFYFYNAVDNTEIGLMPHIALCTQGAAEFSTAKEVEECIKVTAKQSDGVGRKRARAEAPLGFSLCYTKLNLRRSRMIFKKKMRARSQMPSYARELCRATTETPVQ
jgi:hypothetical protein